MTKLLIVDDEPLVQVGLKSMLNWEQLHIEICGTAGNGQTAYEMIRDLKPEIVIADIRMPKVSGLELIKKCHEEFGEIPVFIMLTSYEEFEYAREALRYHAIEYLVKLELTPEVLEKAVSRGLDVISAYNRKHSIAAASASYDLRLFQDRFYIRLLNNLFVDRDQFLHQSEELQISFSSAGYAAAHMEIIPANQSSSGNTLTLYNSTLEMMQDILSKYLPCQVISLDLRYFGIIFFIPGEHMDKARDILKTALEQSCLMLHNYYNVTILSAVGHVVVDPLELSSSYLAAKQLSGLVSPENPLFFIEDMPQQRSLCNVFDLSLFREDIRKAFEEFDEEALHDIFTSISDLFSADTIHYAQALDAASSILHLSITLLTNGSEVVSELFKDEPEGYRSLYQQTTVPQVISWMMRLDEGLCSLFQEQKKNYTNHIVTSVKKYISEHVQERLTLQKISSVFCISPNYLSQLFKKYNDIGFSDYIAQTRIEKAKLLLAQENQKIYEIAEQLGFENAFYFSKVFKKNTGMSPRDYQNRFRQS